MQNIRGGATDNKRRRKIALSLRVGSQGEFPLPSADSADVGDALPLLGSCRSSPRHRHVAQTQWYVDFRTCEDNVMPGCSGAFILHLGFEETEEQLSKEPEHLHHCDAAHMTAGSR